MRGSVRLTQYSICLHREFASNYDCFEQLHVKHTARNFISFFTLEHNDLDTANEFDRTFVGTTMFARRTWSPSRIYELRSM